MRPRLAQPSIRVEIGLRLRPGEDDDLITYFDGMPARKRAAMVKSALRGAGMQAAASDANADGVDEIIDTFVF